MNNLIGHSNKNGVTRIKSKGTGFGKLTAKQYMELQEKGLSESQLQSKCVAWFRETYPDLAKLLHAIPNGANKSIAQAMKFKREGLTPGYPDLELSIARNGFHAAHIEMKRNDGRLSEDQREIIHLLESQGYCVYICKSFDEFKTAIESYLR